PHAAAEPVSAAICCGWCCDSDWGSIMAAKSAASGQGPRSVETLRRWRRSPQHLACAAREVVNHPPIGPRGGPHTLRARIDEGNPECQAASRPLRAFGGRAAAPVLARTHQARCRVGDAGQWFAKGALLA